MGTQASEIVHLTYEVGLRIPQETVHIPIGLGI
jgi:hypothetical protein